ncbi:hypothetical protein GBA63_11930 [Rubrobacter tropicus]|uniref:Uncharacterized protein n=1 Tax=Rubrobacter tropicus TaxID=2653851 RepID=A0A6G8Q9W2_9ACTN|nr:hypothetical protein [Rubrobacter tropicus]QIN83271.1 hypothetical protein GBA63_11930 [Rubrobacter tropicus]
MAIFFHAVMNASGELWKTIPEYSAEPASLAEALARNTHVYLVGAIALWVAAVAAVLVYGTRNLSRRPRQVLADTTGKTQPRAR